MKDKVGDTAYNFDIFYFSTHPHAHVMEHRCPNNLHPRLIEHYHSSDIHVHIGSPGPQMIAPAEFKSLGIPGPS